MMYKPTPCFCPVKELFSSINKKTTSQDFVKITHAEKKQTDSNKSSSSFVVYTINVENVKEAKRRYSEFESFRRSLVRLYPTSLIPPIPEKHSLSDYASDYTSQKQKDDGNIIEKRKRMLQRFLTRLIMHPVLNQEHVLHCFLDGNYSWSDILHSPPLLNLPKDPLLPIDNSFASSIANNLPLTSPATNGATTSIIPIPSSSYTLKYPDKEFQDSESKVDKTAQYTTAQFEKSQKRILRRLGDLSNDYGELGSAYNALSLNETGAVSASIEKLGQVIDGSCKSTKAMVNALEIEFAEHVQDYTQYVSIAKQILRYRRMKQSQLEMIEELIDSKQSTLRGLMRTEDESEKLKTSMDQLSVSSVPSIPANTTSKTGSYSSGSLVDDDSNIDTESIEDGFSAIIKSTGGEDDSEENSKETIVDLTYPSSASAPILRASKNQSKKWSSPRKLFSAVTYTIQGMIDTDPEQTRRNQISKLKDSIEQLDQARLSTRQELKDMSIEIQKDFDRLQIQKEVELKSILISFAKIHMHYCEQNITSWKNIRNEVEITMENML